MGWRLRYCTVLHIHYTTVQYYTYSTERYVRRYVQLGRVSGVSVVPRNVHGLILHDGPAESLVN